MIPLQLLKIVSCLEDLPDARSSTHYSTLLYSLNGLAAQFDCTIALTRAVENLRMTRPIIVCARKRSFEFLMITLII